MPWAAWRSSFTGRGGRWVKFAGTPAVQCSSKSLGLFVVVATWTWAPSWTYLLWTCTNSHSSIGATALAQGVGLSEKWYFLGCCSHWIGSAIWLSPQTAGCRGERSWKYGEQRWDSPFLLSYTCIPTWNESVGWISLLDEKHWPPSHKFVSLVLGIVESKPWTMGKGLRHTCLFSVC